MKTPFGEFTNVEFVKWAKELFFYILSAGLDGSKDKGWKGALFVWPFVVIVFIILYLLYKVLLGGWVR